MKPAPGVSATRSLGSLQWPPTSRSERRQREQEDRRQFLRRRHSADEFAPTAAHNHGHVGLRRAPPGASLGPVLSDRRAGGPPHRTQANVRRTRPSGRVTGRCEMASRYGRRRRLTSPRFTCRSLIAPIFAG